MTKKIGLTVAAVALLLGATPAYAQDGTRADLDARRAEAVQFRAELQADYQEAHAENQAAREEHREDRADAIEAHGEARVEARAEIESLPPEERQAAAEEKRAELEADRAAKRAEMVAKRADMLRASTDRMVSVYQAAIDRLSVLADRLEERIGLIEADHSIDLSLAISRLDDARGLIVDAQASVDAIPAKADELATELANAETMEDAKALLAELKDMFHGARASIKAAHGPKPEGEGPSETGLRGVVNAIKDAVKEHREANASADAEASVE